MKRTIFLLCCLISIPAVAAEPLTQPAPVPLLFGLGQDCVNGQCFQPTMTRQVYQSSVFGLQGRTVNRSVTRSRMVIPAPVVFSQPTQAAYTEREIEVPVRKVVTVMEKRTVREYTAPAPVYYQVQAQSCVSCNQSQMSQGCQTQRTQQTYQRSVQRSTSRRGWNFPLLRRLRARSNGLGFFQRSSVAGGDVYSHLLEPPHNYQPYQLAGLSRGQLESLHSSDHGW